MENGRLSEGDGASLPRLSWKKRPLSRCLYSWTGCMWDSGWHWPLSLCGLSGAGHCRYYECAPGLTILRFMLGGCQTNVEWCQILSCNFQTIGKDWTLQPSLPSLIRDHPHLRFFTLWMTLTCVINRVILIIYNILHAQVHSVQS